MVCTAGDKVVGVESKKLDDLRSSISARRLARQIRTLQAEVDVPCLLMRGPLPDLRACPWSEYADIFIYLVSVQMLGVTILWGSGDDFQVRRALEAYRPLLAGGRPVLVGVAGTDQRKPATLLRAVPGIGRGMETRLLSALGTPRQVFNASAEQLREAGATRRVVENLQKMLEVSE